MHLYNTPERHCNLIIFKSMAEQHISMVAHQVSVNTPANVEITEESAPATTEEKNKSSNEEPKPIVEEPNANTVPQLNVIPETNSSSENTVITEITASETKEAAPKNKIVKIKAMASDKTGPEPPRKSTIIREEGAPDLPPAANTIFILDLMKQKQEKLRRKKKDDMILEMALKMKKEKEEAKRGQRSSYSYNSGGFAGVGVLTAKKPMPGKSPQLHRKVCTKLYPMNQANF